MCIANKNQGYVEFPDGLRRFQDGTELRPGDKGYIPTVGGKRPMKAVDVPLGDGLAENARQSILSRRERLREASGGEM
jgi:hypothetical protein